MKGADFFVRHTQEALGGPAVDFLTGKHKLGTLLPVGNFMTFDQQTNIPFLQMKVVGEFTKGEGAVRHKVDI